MVAGDVDNVVVSAHDVKITVVVLEAGVGGLVAAWELGQVALPHPLVVPPQSRQAGGSGEASTRNNTMSELRRIDINPKVMLGKPVIRGTRITVELILRKLAEGATFADLTEAYPHLLKEDIQAAIAYAADTVANEETVLVEPRG